MKTTAILVAVAMIAMATPTYAVEETSNLDALRELILDADKADQIEGDVYGAEFEARVADVLAVAEEREINIADLLEPSEETGGFPQASDFFALIEVAITGSDLCPAPTAVASPAPGNMPWSYGSPEYIGTATSEASAAGSGFFIDMSTGKAFPYSQVVTYTGASDFYCDSIEFFGIWITINFPYVTGVAIDG